MYTPTEVILPSNTSENTFTTITATYTISNHNQEWSACTALTQLHRAASIICNHIILHAIHPDYRNTHIENTHTLTCLLVSQLFVSGGRVSFKQSNNHQSGSFSWRKTLLPFVCGCPLYNMYFFGCTLQISFPPEMIKLIKQSVFISVRSTAKTAELLVWESAECLNKLMRNSGNAPENKEWYHCTYVVLPFY